MRFQPKSLLVGVVLAGVGALGYAAVRGAGQGSSIDSLLEATFCRAGDAQADVKPHDHAQMMHEHVALAQEAPQSKVHEHGVDEHAAHEHEAHEHADQSHVAVQKILGVAEPAAATDQYTCPMHPSIVSNEPGNCPICGMHLVKIVRGGSDKEIAQVHVDAQTQQRMGVQLQAAQRVGMHRAINTFATITQDQTRSVSVSSFVEGWIKRWHVQGVGQKIRKGQVLYEIYSPDLQQRQREYVNILTRRDAMQSSKQGMGMTAGKSADMSGPSFVMMRAVAQDRFRARDRLLAAGIPAKVLEQLEEYRKILDVVPIQAMQDGIVTEISAREGSYINPSQPLLVYTDSSQVWAEVTLYPDQVVWLEDGNDVTLTSGLDATTRIQARVDLSTLQIDPASRTAKLRLPISNVGNAFYPGSYAKAAIKADARQVLSVPRDAVIRTGHGQYVVVSEGQDHFRSVPVDTGIENTDLVEIRSGLQPGTRVVVNGQFLLDAAASLQSMQSRLAALSPQPGHDADAAGAPHAAPVVSAVPVSMSSHAHP